MTEEAGAARHDLRGEDDLLAVPARRYPGNRQEWLVAHRHSPVFHRVVPRLLKLLGVEIPTSVLGAERLRLPHGAVGLVVHHHARIGVDVRLYQGVTLGRSDTYLPDRLTSSGGGVVVEDGVVVGAGAVVLFRSGQTLTLGRDCVIGANSVVLQDVPAGEIWAGNPATRRGVNIAAR